MDKLLEVFQGKRTLIFPEFDLIVHHTQGEDTHRCWQRNNHLTLIPATKYEFEVDSLLRDRQRITAISGHQSLPLCCVFLDK